MALCSMLLATINIVIINTNSISDGYTINLTQSNQAVLSNHVLLITEYNDILFNFWICSDLPNTLNVNKYNLINDTVSLINTFTINLSPFENLTASSISTDYAYSNISNLTIFIAISYSDYSVQKQIIQLYHFKLTNAIYILL